MNHELFKIDRGIPLALVDASTPTAPVFQSDALTMVSAVRRTFSRSVSEAHPGRARTELPGVRLRPLEV